MTTPHFPLTLILAQIRTLDPQQPTAEAALVGGGRVLAVGSRADLTALAPRADVVDHRDLILTPGLTDAHVHPAMYGFSLTNVNLVGVTLAEALARVRERADATPANEWIKGDGFSLHALGLDRYPTAEELDAVSPNHPVLLLSMDQHMAWANSLALRLAGIHDQTPDPATGRFVRPLGTLLEDAIKPVVGAAPAPTHAQYVDAVRRAAQDLVSRGFTGMHSMGYEHPGALAALLDLSARGELPLRVWSCINPGDLDAFEAAGLWGGAGGNVVVGGLKFFADGALGSRTAWVFPPGFADGSGEGIPLHTPDMIREVGRRGLELGLSLVTHAIGERANHEVLNAYEALAPLARASGVRLRIEHAQHLRDEDIPRFAQLNVTASVQPLHLVPDGPAIRALLPHLEAGTYAFRRLLDAGALVAIGSDAPIALPDPAATFRAALTRLDETGTPIAPDEALTAEEVLFGYTRAPALAVGWEDEGLVRTGARARFTLWDEVGGRAQALVLEG